jgi:hypothetical protein
MKFNRIQSGIVLVVSVIFMAFSVMDFSFGFPRYRPIMVPALVLFMWLGIYLTRNKKAN